MGVGGEGGLTSGEISTCLFHFLNHNAHFLLSLTEFLLDLRQLRLQFHVLIMPYHEWWIPDDGAQEFLLGYLL
jgi:hypothetical protein